MGKIVSVSTNKGGVLKTSITCNLAGVLAKEGKSVLIVDTDNQGNAILSFGKNPDKFEQTIYDVLVNRLDPKKAIVRVHKRIDVLPSNDSMEFFEFDVLSNLKQFPEPFYLLRNALGGLERLYDYILIDTPPNLGLTQGNVLSFADAVLIPFQPEVYSMRSLIKMMNSVDSFRERHNPKLEILGVVATLVDSRTVLHSEVLQQCRALCDRRGIRMYETVIPRTIANASSVAFKKKPVTLSVRPNRLKQIYFDLMEEIAKE